jgi:hypothetical protein
MLKNVNLGGELQIMNYELRVGWRKKSHLPALLKEGLLARESLRVCVLFCKPCLATGRQLSHHHINTLAFSPSHYPQIIQLEKDGSQEKDQE